MVAAAAPELAELPAKPVAPKSSVPSAPAAPAESAEPAKADVIPAAGADAAAPAAGEAAAAVADDAAASPAAGAPTDWLAKLETFVEKSVPARPLANSAFWDTLCFLKADCPASAAYLAPHLERAFNALCTTVAAKSTSAAAPAVAVVDAMACSAHGILPIL